MKKVAQLLEELKVSGIIVDYALFGAVARIVIPNRLQPSTQMFLVLLSGDAGMGCSWTDLQFWKKRGHVPEGEAVLLEDWPVRFLPVFSSADGGGCS